MVSISHAISMPEKTWEEIDLRLNRLNLTRSGYLQLLVEKDLDSKKRDYRFIDVVMMCILFVIILLLVMVVFL